jgi:uncharacterized protein (DUF2147 family)
MATPSMHQGRHALRLLAALSAFSAAWSLALPAQASNLEGFAGFWITPDQSVVEIKPCAESSHLCGYLVVAREYGADALNPDVARRSRPICGLQILELRQFSDGVWRDGSVYDPEVGKTYKAALRMREGKLFLRGYLGTEVFGETEVWTTANDFRKRCTP